MAETFLPSFQLNDEGNDGAEVFKDLGVLVCYSSP